MGTEVKLEVGHEAPRFSLPASDGSTVSLNDYLGKKRIVLYFYPKDDTPGCTKEACSFRDWRKEIEKHDAVVFGLSSDSLKSHEKFVNKYQLNFPLLSDVDHQVAEAYGAWGEKAMYGKKYFGMIRKTFIIGKDGKILYANHKVQADGHAEEILAVLEKL